MTAPFQGIPLVMGHNGLAVPIRLAEPAAPAANARQEREKEAWPVGKKAPHGGWNPLRNGLDLVAELGFMKAPGSYVLARAVMTSDLSDIILGVDDHTRNALCWEVKDVGPSVPAAAGVKPGDYVIQISTVSDAVEPRKAQRAESRYCFMHWEDIAAVWDHKALMAALEGTEHMDLDELKAHVAQTPSGKAPIASAD